MQKNNKFLFRHLFKHLEFNINIMSLFCHFNL